MADLIVAKHRNGGLDRIKLRFKGEITKFVNPERDEEMQPPPEEERLPIPEEAPPVEEYSAPPEDEEMPF